MYSPKIDAALIPRLYRLGKALNMPMTRLVNQLLEHGIVRLEQAAEHVHDAPAQPRKKRGRKEARHERT